MAATYVRGSGPHIAERVRPAPGSNEETALAALAGDPASGWRCTDGQPPAAEPVKRPARSASKTDWVAYAVTQGASEEDATAATRDELAALYEDGDA